MGFFDDRMLEIACPKCGPAVLPYSLTVPVRSTGIHGFDLFDREGVFGPSERLLATYMYSITFRSKT